MKVAVPGAAMAVMATGTAVAFVDHAPSAREAVGASSSLQLKREVPASRDALRPPVDVDPAQAQKPVAKHLKKQAPIPKTSDKTRAAEGAKTLPPVKVVGSKYTITDVNVWSAAGGTGSLLTVLEKGSKVAVTGTVDGLWAQVVRDGVVRWVKAQYLSATKPVAGGVSQEACKSGSSVENGLTADAVRVHRAICNKFPNVTSYGGLRSGDSGSEHSSGRGWM